MPDVFELNEEKRDGLVNLQISCASIADTITEFEMRLIDWPTLVKRIARLGVDCNAYLAEFLIAWLAIDDGTVK